MTNGEKFKEIFSVTQVDDCDLNVYAWLPNHDAIEIPLEWWNAEYKEPKAGHWIKVTNGRGGHECDLCHEYEPSYQSGKEYLTNYCPNCGAKMIEQQGSEE